MIPRKLGASRNEGVERAVVCFVALGLLLLLVVPPLWPNDETSHVAYGLVVAEGQLPTIDTPIPRGQLDALDDRLERDERWGDVERLDIAAASHPPLFYMISAVPLRAGAALGFPLTGLYLSRFLVVLIGAATTALVGWLASAVVPARPRVAVVAAGLWALTPNVLYHSAIVQNDVLCAALTTAAFGGAVIAVRRRLNAALLIGTTISAGGAALTRASGVITVGFTALLIMVAAWRSASTRGRLQRSALAAAAGTAVAAGGFLIAGWFYLRNIALYGDATAAEALLEKFGRSERESLLAVAIAPEYWLTLSDQLWGRVASGKILTAQFRVPARVMTIALLVLAVFKAATGLRSWRPLSLDTLLWGVLLLYSMVLAASLTAFTQRGGSPNARYLLPGLPVVAVALAALLEKRRPRRLPVDTLSVILASLALANAAWLLRFVLTQSDGHLSGAGPALLFRLGPQVGTLAVAGLTALFVWGFCGMSLADPPSPKDKAARWKRG